MSPECYVILHLITALKNRGNCESPRLIAGSMRFPPHRLTSILDTLPSPHSIQILDPRSSVPNNLSSVSFLAALLFF